MQHVVFANNILFSMSSAKNPDSCANGTDEKVRTRTEKDHTGTTTKKNQGCAGNEAVFLKPVRLPPRVKLPNKPLFLHLAYSSRYHYSVAYFSVLHEKLAKEINKIKKEQALHTLLAKRCAGEKPGRLPSPPNQRKHRPMLKKTIVCAFLLLPLAAHAAPELKKNNISGDLNWSVQTTWTLPTKPLDIAQSLDNKKVFILGADAKVHIFAPDGKKLGDLPVDANISAIDIAPRGEMLYLINDKTNSYTAIDVSFNQRIDITGAPVLGQADAPITLVIFSDFECPWCGKMEPVLKQLLDTNKDKLRIVFKHLPLPMHPQAEPAALAAIAAQKQDKFWQMHDALFQVTNWTPGVIDETAVKIGLNMEKFKADLSNPDTEKQLAKDKADAQMADVVSTPSLFVNGRPVRDRTLVALQAMVNEALAASGAK